MSNVILSRFGNCELLIVEVAVIAPSVLTANPKPDVEVLASMDQTNFFAAENIVLEGSVASSAPAFICVMPDITICISPRR